VYDAIVLAGGAARRLGGADKPGLGVGGRTLLDRVLAAVPDASRVVVVGPGRPVSTEVVWCRENPPGGGPVAALAAGLGETSAEVVVTLAADLPFVAPGVQALRRELDAEPDAGAAFLVDAGGRVDYLAGAWRRDALAAALDAVGPADNTAMRALVAETTWAPVSDTGGWTRDCDTWDDVAAARAAARAAAAREAKR
jgi:molybdopterin-guanine dinucleotide biosynthesis protein A